MRYSEQEKCGIQGGGCQWIKPRHMKQLRENTERFVDKGLMFW